METVLVTGAARGIGLELTRQYLAHGQKVIATYRGHGSDALTKLSSNENLSLYEVEVTSQSSIQNLSSSIANETIDIVINNAGVIGPIDETLESLSADAWRNTFEVNTIAPLIVSQALLANLKRSPNPRLISISSQMGAMSRVKSDMAAYRSSKAALNKAMQCIALELAPHNIIVCPMHPGWVSTDMGGEDADITPTDSAAGIIAFIESVTMASSGKFFTWEGESHDW